MANGYKSKTVDGKIVRLHRYIMEKHIGRKLTNDEIVHHIDGDILNNSISNLEVMTISAHNQIAGRNKPSNKLTPSDIPVVRKMLRDNIKPWLIAKAYGMSRWSICQVGNGTTWYWVN